MRPITDYIKSMTNTQATNRTDETMTNATAQQTGLVSYHPEMGEARPDALIDASVGHGGTHYLKSQITLTGRGVTFIKTFKASDLVPQAQYRVGQHEYRVTKAAFARVCRENLVASESLL